MSIDIQPFGTTEHGEETQLITFSNATGAVMKVTTYGAAITELHLPDRDGNMADCVLGFDNLKQYETDSPSFGCCCGRVANRIRNGQFSLDGKDYQLTQNHHGHTLHGGARGFGKRVWKYQTHESADGPQITMTYVSVDGEEGFPATLTSKLAYSFTNNNTIKLAYEATSDAPTIVNLTNHSYFNLAGHDSGEVTDHLLKINAETYTVNDDQGIPTGEIASVFDEGNNIFNFTEPKSIGQDLEPLKTRPCGGYDLNYGLDNDGELALAATVFDPNTGRIMHCYTDQPGIQLYTAGNMHETFGGKGCDLYRKFSAICLETQKYADAVHHPEFPSIVLRPGETYTHQCEYHFGVADGIED